MTRPWLTLIGIGEDGALNEAARSILVNADIVYASQRHFDLAGPLDSDCRTWPSPFSNVFEDLKALSGRKVAILASGDPQWYGIGASLVRHIPADEISVFPAPSAFQLAASRLGWALQETECLSIHGRTADALRCQLYPGAKILLLTSNAEAPEQVADILVEEGYGQSQMTVLEHLGGPAENLFSGCAETWSEKAADFHTLAIEVAVPAHLEFKSRAPGLPDDAFRHDGKMTKQDVRAATLAELRPYPGALLWDIGAGCGSVAIEWLRAADRAKAIGLEPDATRRQLAAENAVALGVPGLQLLGASAPEGLTNLPEPDAIFIGGGLTADNLVEFCLKALRSGGRLVGNAVTLEGENVLAKSYTAYGGNLKRISIQRADKVGTMTGWRPAMTVTQWSYTKA